MSRLKEIVAACGGVLLDGGARALIPGPDHSRHDRSVSLRETENGRVLIHCFSPRDDWRTVRRWLAEQDLLDEPDIGPVPAPRRPATQFQPDADARIDRARRLWDEGRPILRTIAAAYLQRRAIDLDGDVAALRFHPRMTSLEDRGRRPALMAAIVDLGGEVQGVQVTLLSPHGRAKATLATPRRVIGKLMGGAVRLNDLADELMIGEGVETMLSASAALRLPAWAALSADNLAQFDAPKSIRRLVIAADHDQAGRTAAETLKHRIAHCAVDIVLPPDGANDWNAWATREGVRSKG